MILLLNDDGIHAPGLRSLYHHLRAVCKTPVLAVAPAIQHSGQAHAITLDRGLTVSHHLEEGFFGFSIDGTPVDCLKLALKVLCPQAPRLVISGINDGPNIGRSLFYSGTVAAAMEGAIEGQVAIAVSRDRSDASWEHAAAFAAELAAVCLDRRELRGLVLNCNIPARPRAEWGELRLVRHGRSGFEERYRPSRARSGLLTWRLHGERVELDDEGETDAHALAAGHPTLTVLQPNYNVLSDALPKRLLKRLQGETAHSA